MNKTIIRIGIAIGCLIAILAVLAYVGVNFAQKPISWMPTAFFFVILFLTIGIAWAYNPYFMKIKSKRNRYAAEGVAVFITVLITAYLGYMIFGNLWLLFGGSL